jgi:hypothetical protein
MTGRTVAIIVAIFALPAHGETPPPPTELEIHTLSPIDSVPTKDELSSHVEGPDYVARLEALALDSTVDFGIQLRAIRALPSFCAAQCKDTPPHIAVLAVIASVPSTDHSGRALLRLRAGIEALGIVKSGKLEDVNLLVPFLDNASRDIRAATARALRDMCNTTAIVPLRARYQHEMSAQVRLAISAALRDLDQCN